MADKEGYPGKYKVKAIRTVFAIIFFILIYLLILILSFSLVASLFYLSYIIISNIPLKNSAIYYFILFLLVFIIAIALLVFVIAFFFRKSSIDRSGWLEVNEEQQPKLFNQIKNISDEIQTNFPQRVYLGIGVEAMVFYDSNFKNLFFPSKENLMIGLGLVNSITESEFRAILAHEFGHFTQRNWNVYSYVYIENQIIFKMLIDEEYYQTLLHQFISFGRLVWVVIVYSKFIRWVLRKAYEIVSKSYMALSREMEYHADEISARVAGSVPAVTSLLRSSLASDAFNYVWQFYSSRLPENIKTENVYPQHLFTMNKFAERYGVKTENKLPAVTKETILRFNRSKLNLVNQWASHPTTMDRISRLEELNINSEISNESAWNYFDDTDSIQKTLTEKLFRNFPFKDSPSLMSFEEFKKNYAEDADKHNFDKKYNYFYEFRDISKFDIPKAIALSEDRSTERFEQLFSNENVNLIERFSGLTMDMKTVESISKKDIKVESFEYDGTKFNSDECDDLLIDLKKQHEEMYKKVQELDINVFIFFYNLSKQAGKEEELIKYYQTYFELLDEDKRNLQIYLDLINSMQFIFTIHSFSKIRTKLEQMEDQEDKLRERIAKILADEKYTPFLTDELAKKFHNYLSAELEYFDGEKYNDVSLKSLEETIFNFYEVCSKAPFYGLKKLLDFQIELIDSSNSAKN